MAIWTIRRNSYQTIHLPLEGYAHVFDAECETALSEAGSLEFDMPITHPLFDEMVTAGTMTDDIITVDRDNETVWWGRVAQIEDQRLDSIAHFTCEGELAYLNDTNIDHYYVYTSPKLILTHYLNKHNEQCGLANEGYKRFYTGSVTIPDKPVVNRWHATPVNTWDEIREKTFGSDLGGYLMVRHVGKNRYLDWLKEPNTGVGQEVILGLNLLSLTGIDDGTELVTVIRPLGQSSQNEANKDLTDQLNITSISDRTLKGGVTKKGAFLINDALYKKHGWHCIDVSWDSVEKVDSLLENGRQYCAALADNITYNVRAVDLTDAGYEAESFKLGQRVHLLANGLEANLMVSRIKWDLSDPGNTVVSFGPVARTQSVQATESSIVIARASVDSQQANVAAQAASAIANVKRRVFTATPVPPYDAGDLWVQANGNIYVCKTAKES